MKIKMPVVITAIGALAGYFLLSPFSVYISHVVHKEMPVREISAWEVFSHEPLSWTLSFALFGAAIGLLIGLLYNGIRERTARIKEAKDYIDLMVNSLGEGLLTINRDYRIVRANRAYLDQAGEENEENVVGKHCYQVSHRREKPCYEAGEDCPVQKVFKTGTAATAAHIHRDKEGGAVHVELSAYPIRDSSGKVVQALEVVRDVTGRKRAEEALQKYADELERSNRLKDLFTDVMRHDLLSPVGVIEYVSGVLAEDGRFRDSGNLAMIQRNVKKLEDMIQNASKYARVENAKSLEKGEEDLAAIIRSAIDGLRPYYEERGMKIKFESKGEAKAMLNPMIEDVFSNILSNAVKYTPENTTITVDVVSEGEGWLVSFADQGEGVPGEYKESIFERFTRRNKNGVKGTGLGLAIAKRIVDLHGGRIWVEDNPEGGSVFYVSLPKEAPVG